MKKWDMAALPPSRQMSLRCCLSIWAVLETDLPAQNIKCPSAQKTPAPYTYEIVTNLINAAKRQKLDFAVDVYPYYGSDADAALTAGHDVKHGLIGAGIYASHGYERSHTDGVLNTFCC